jgi:WD40 repeat protein
MCKFTKVCEISANDPQLFLKKRVLPVLARCALILLLACLVFLQWSAGVTAPLPEKDAPAPLVNHVDQLGDPLPAEAVLRFGSSRFCHPGGVCCLVWSPDGKTILSSAGNDNDALLWDCKTGKLLRRFRGHNWGVASAVFVSCGKHVITQGGDSIRCWDIGTGKELWRYEEQDKYWHGLFLTPDGKTLICPCPEIYCWDVETGKRTRKIPVLPGDVKYWIGTALTRDATRLALRDREHIQLWNLDTEKQIANLKVEESEVVLCFTADSNILVCHNEDGFVLREAASGKKIKTIKPPTKVEVFVAFSADGKQMAYRSEERTLVLCEFPSGKEIRRFEAAHRDRISARAFSPDGKTLAAGGENSIYLWDVATGKDVRPEAVKQREERSDAVLSDDGKLLANAIITRDAQGIGKTREIEVWDVPSAKCLHTIHIPGDADKQFAAKFEFSRDRKHLIATMPDQIVTWDLTTGRIADKRNSDVPRPAKDRPTVRTPEGRKNQVNHAVCPETSIGAATFDEDEQGKELALVLFSIADGKEIRALDWKRQRFGSLIFSPDGRTLAGGGGGSDTHDIFLWDVATGRLQAVLQGHIGDVIHLSFSRDSTTLVSSSADTTTLVWDLKRCGREGATPPAKLNEREAAALYKDLANDDAAIAYRAVWGLVAAPNDALPVLRKQLTPVPTADARQVQQWLSDLGHDDFATRETASKELGRRDEGMQADLKKFLEEPPLPEAKRRATELLDRLISERSVPSAEQRQLLGAVEALERMNTDEARKFLAELAKGQPGARLTKDAKLALERLTQR